MRLLGFCDNERKNKNNRFIAWKIFWLMDLIEFVLLNQTIKGFPVEIWKVKVKNSLKKILVNGIEYEYPELDYSDLIKGDYVTLPRAMKAFGALMAYLYGFNNKEVFIAGFKKYPKELPDLKNYNNQVLISNLTNIYYLLLSGKLNLKNETAYVLLQKTLNVINLEEVFAEFKIKKNNANIKILYLYNEITPHDKNVELLREKGFSVVAFSEETASEMLLAIKEMDDLRFDLIVLDFMIKEGEFSEYRYLTAGAKLYEELRSLSREGFYLLRNIPVLINTSFTARKIKIFIQNLPGNDNLYFLYDTISRSLFSEKVMAILN